MVIIRILTNIFVLASLVAGGLAIFYAVQFSTSQQLKVVSRITCDYHVTDPGM